MPCVQAGPLRGEGDARTGPLLAAVPLPAAGQQPLEQTLSSGFLSSSDKYGAACRQGPSRETAPPGLDPHWPLCPYELRGACRNAQCPFQMAADRAAVRSGCAVTYQSWQ